MTLFFAQCVMCFRSAAAQQAERSRVLNEGIVILLVPPFLVIGAFLALAWYRNKVHSHKAGISQSDGSESI